MDWNEEKRKLVLLLDEKRYAEAQQLGEMLIEMETSRGDAADWREILTVRQILGIALFHDEQFDKAAAQLEVSLQIYQKLAIASSDKHVIAAQMVSGICLDELKLFAKAEERLAAALESLQTVDEPDHSLIATLQKRLALIYDETNQTTKALEFFEIAIAAQITVHAAATDIAKSRREFGVLLLKAGQHDKAISQFQTAYSLFLEHGVSPEDFRVIQVRQDLARAYARAGEHSRAIELLDELIMDISAIKDVGRDEKLANAYETRAAIGAAQKNYEQAIFGYQRAIDVLAGSDTRDAEHLAAVHGKLATINIEAGNYDLARASFERAIATCQSVKGPKLAEADYHHRLAILLVKLGDHHEAQSHLARASELFVLAYGINHPLTLLLKQESADQLGASGLHEKALAEYQNVLNNLKNIGKSIYFNASAIYERMAEIHEKLGDTNSTENDLKLALDLKREWLSVGHPGVAELQSKLGDFYWKTNRKEEARAAYTQALTTFSSTFGADYTTALHISSVLAESVI
jgi:tetratricopeptide (TPR) repeat protein